MLKKLKIGFAAIVAVLAVSATLASHAGAFQIAANKKAGTFGPGCFRNVTTTGPNAVTYTQDQAPCPTLPEADSRLVVNASLQVADPSPSGNCPIAPQLCCVQVDASDIVTAIVCGEFE